MYVCECVCVLAYLEERAPGTNISRLHVVNILENRAVAVATFTFLLHRRNRAECGCTKNGRTGKTKEIPELEL